MSDQPYPGELPFDSPPEEPSSAPSPDSPDSKLTPSPKKQADESTPEASDPTPALRARRDELRQLIAHHDERYYREATPEITDFEYDKLKAELNRLEESLGNEDDTAPPVPALVGDDRLPGFTSRPHRIPMLSLDNTYSETELRAFDARLRRLLEREEDLTYTVEPKLDGLAISLTYKNGTLTQALTRGNGIEGDDVTANIRTIQTLPTQLKGTGHPPLIEIRGEVYLSLEEFQRINREREEAGLPRYMNPRNLTAGTVKQLDSREVARRKLELVVHGLGFCEEPPFETLSAFHQRLVNWGLPALERTWQVTGFEAAWQAIEELAAIRDRFAYATDGAVLKLDALALHRTAGATSKSPRWAIAYKFAPEQAETRLQRISFQVGRTGVITPVAELTPVLLAGTTVSRATLHNEDEIARKDIRPGDTVVVEKAGEIIPAVVRVIPAQRPPESQPFNYAEALREAGFEAERPPGQAFWRLTADDNPDQQRRRLEHFAARASLDIEGLGTAVIKLLLDEKLVASPADLYNLTASQIGPLEGFAAKSARNLIEAIDASRRQPLWRLLHALGIPQVGAQSAKTLARAFGSLDALSTADEEALQQVEDVGPIVAASIRTWFAQPRHAELIDRLRTAGLNLEATAEEKPAPANGPLQGQTWVITGILPTLSRDEAKALIEQHGGKVSGSVSKKTTALLAGENAGSKLTKAETLGIPVVSEEELRERLES